MSKRLRNILIHSIAAGLSVLLTVIVLAQGPDRTVALSPTRRLPRLTGPPREIRLILENQLSHVVSSLPGQRLASQPALEGPQEAAAIVDERVLRWGTVELPLYDHVKQAVLNQFSAEVRKFWGEPNHADPNAGPIMASPWDPNRPDPNAEPITAGPWDPNHADPNAGPIMAGPWDPNRPGPNAEPIMAGPWDPNEWPDRCPSYEGIVNNYPDTALKVAVANQIGVFLCQQSQLGEAVRWFEHILPDADQLKLGHCVRLNMALTYLDLAQTVEAKDMLQVILDGTNPTETDPHLWGLYLMATGIMGNIEQVERNPERAMEHLDRADRRLEVLSAGLPYQTWPAFYTGMVHIWRLRIAVEYGAAGQYPPLAELHEEFLRTVPLSRWTWLQHQVFRDMLERHRLPDATVAVMQDQAEGLQP